MKKYIPLFAGPFLISFSQDSNFVKTVSLIVGVGLVAIYLGGSHE